MGDRLVTAALVVVQTRTGVRHLYHGDIVPPDIKPESLANLESLGYVTSEVEAPTSERPPVAGPGSAKEKWLAYAAFHNVAVGDDASKDDVIAAVTAAGH